MDKNSELDVVDHQILAILAEDALVPYTDIAKQIHVSSGTVHVRMKKLRQMGIVKGARLELDYSKLGFDVCAFLGICLDSGSYLDDIIEQLQNIPEVVSVHCTTGHFNLFVKIICRDTRHLHQLLHGKIHRFRGVQRTESFVSVEESVDRSLRVKSEE